MGRYVLSTFEEGSDLITDLIRETNEKIKSIAQKESQLNRAQAELEAAQLKQQKDLKTKEAEIQIELEKKLAELAKEKIRFKEEKLRIANLHFEGDLNQLDTFWLTCGPIKSSLRGTSVVYNILDTRTSKFIGSNNSGFRSLEACKVALSGAKDGLVCSMFKSYIHLFHISTGEVVAQDPYESSHSNFTSYVFGYKNANDCAESLQKVDEMGGGEYVCSGFSNIKIYDSETRRKISQRA